MAPTKFVNSSMSSKKKSKTPQGDDITDEDAGTLIDCFFNEYGLHHSQKESYNEMIMYAIPAIIEHDDSVVVDVLGQKYTVTFGSPVFQRPVHKEISDEVLPITPKQCIDRDITYMSHMYVDVTMENPLGFVKTEKNVHIASIPVMVGSQLCNLFDIANDPDEMARLGEDIHDEGGYFIINGAEKVIVHQQRSAQNRTYVFQSRKTAPKYDLYTEIRSIAPHGAHGTTVQVGILKNNLIGVIVPYIEMSDIPLGVMFRALGAKNENDMIRYMVPDSKDVEFLRLLVPSLEQAYACSSQDDALYYIGKKGKKFMGVKKDDEEVEEESVRSGAISYARHLISTEFLPHLGSGEESFTKKRFYLGYMVQKLLDTKLGRKPIENRDHYSNKRVALTGALLGTQFYNAFNRLRSEIATSIEKCIRGSNTVNILSMVKPRTIRTAMCNALSNNNWGGKSQKQGISQTYDKFNRAATIANARKISAAVGTEGVTSEKRREQDNTHWGMVCPAEVPEGKTCFTLDTPVLTPKGYIPIGKLSDGDEVISVDPKTFQTQVTAITEYFTIVAYVLTITLKDGRQVTCTEDHPFLSSGDWIEAGKLEVGDLLYVYSCDSQIESTPIVSIVRQNEKRLVADFTTLSDNHSFIANGIITHNCGLVTNQAMSCLVTIGSDPGEIAELVENMNIISFTEVEEQCSGSLLKLVKIFLNGDIIGVTDHPNEIVNELRMLRRSGCLNPEVSMAYDDKAREVHISTDAGRLCRPLLIVEGGKILLKRSHIEQIRKGEWDEEPGSAWMKLLEGGFIELLDTFEEEYTDIATFPSDLITLDKTSRAELTHSEIYPSLILGVGASLIPFPDHNQSPRNTYQSAMGKQAIGVPGANYMVRTKGKYHVLNYPQKPVVLGKMAKIIKYDRLPAGQNAITVLMVRHGFNQEDSLILNQDSIDRGFMNSTAFFGFEAKVKRDKDEQFEVPSEKECSNFKGNPRKLDPVSGIITEGQKVQEGDILIGKTVRVDETLTVHRHKKQNCSIIYDQPLPGVVHLVQTGIDGQGYEYVKVMIRQLRIPEYGDKFAARHGQKGTCGMTYKSTELPFMPNRGGIAPDIMVNPLALPSRMTIGMLIEMLCGRMLCDASELFQAPVDRVFRLDDKKWNNPPDEPDCESESESNIEFVDSDDDVPRDEIVTGVEYDSTPFRKDYSLEKICERLRELGIDEFSDEVLIDGETGEELEALVYTGVCYYQRLKHMVVDKIHARSRGGTTRMTRQPREGRKLGGGFRIGLTVRFLIILV